MYLLLFRKPHTIIHFTPDPPPAEFDFGGDHYQLLRRPLISAAWRVDGQGYPVAAFCRLVPGERWPADIQTLPRLTWEGETLVFWLTTERHFEAHDLLCDDVFLYHAGAANFAFAFSLEGVSYPHSVQPLVLT